MPDFQGHPELSVHPSSRMPPDQATTPRPLAEDADFVMQTDHSGIAGESHMTPLMPPAIPRAGPLQVARTSIVRAPLARVAAPAARGRPMSAARYPAPRTLATAALCLALAACSAGGGGIDPFDESGQLREEFGGLDRVGGGGTAAGERDNGRFFDLFRDNDDPNTTVKVNRYIWNAALDVLDFLPIQQVDPFSGVITTGYGTPPGSSQAYRATVLVRDPALDARSLSVALQDRSGRPVAAETQRAVEDAILTRARQLRIAAGEL